MYIHVNHFKYTRPATRKDITIPKKSDHDTRFGVMARSAYAFFSRFLVWSQRSSGPILYRPVTRPPLAREVIVTYLTQKQWRAQLLVIGGATAKAVAIDSLRINSGKVLPSPAQSVEALKHIKVQ